MARIQSTGKCELCGGSFGKAAMTRHLKTCLETHGGTAPGKAAGKPKPAFHLLVQGRQAPEYWLHLQVRADATLEPLDGFLRGIWLECCGHMSAFNIAGQGYSAEPMDEMDDAPMDQPLSRLLSPGMEFEYEYDFGSTTELALKVVGEHLVPGKSQPVELLAQNDPPPIACDVCGKPARVVCAECVYDTGGWLCNKCAKQHPCGPDMQLPVVNSPRVGVCGYTG